MIFYYFPKQNSLLRILLEEIQSDFAIKVADKVNKPANDSGYAQIAEFLKVSIRDRFYKEVINDIKTGYFKF